MIKKIGIRLFEGCRTFSCPPHWKAIWRNRFPGKPSLHPDRDHLQAAIDWLCRAQDATGCGGVSAGYFFRRGWMHPYPETTGYIIPTFLRYATLRKEEIYRERALRMGDWEIDIQLPSGAVRGGRGRIGEKPYPIVFNTGQVLLGWTTLYRATGLNRFLDAAVRAADWLADVQDADGKWSRHAYMDAPHVYHTRVAWPLLDLFDITQNDSYRTPATRHLDWALQQTRPNGWFAHMSLEPDSRPLTHTIAYTLRGLLESSAFLPEIRQPILEIVRKASENIISAISSRPGALPPATFDAEWNSPDSHSCLSGNAQLAVLWLKLHEINEEARFANTALSLLDQVKTTQSLHASHPGIRGGIAGSQPLWGGYIPYAYLNWATKFFADALICKERVLDGQERID